MWRKILSSVNKNKINKMKSDLNVGILMSDVKPVSYSNWVETWFPTLVDNVNVEFINARSERVREDIDLLIIVGGRDVYPARYGEKPHLNTGVPDMLLEWWDVAMLPQYIERTKTGKLGILCICRGMQTLNVTFGGQLSQDIPQEYSGKDTPGKLVDKLTIVSDFKADWLRFKAQSRDKNGDITVCSRHHQGVFAYNLAKELEIVAVNSSFGNNVEVLKHKALNIWGCQFHPESQSMLDIDRYMLTNLINNIKQ